MVLLLIYYWITIVGLTAQMLLDYNCCSYWSPFNITMALLKHCHYYAMNVCKGLLSFFYFGSTINRIEHVTQPTLLCFVYCSLLSSVVVYMFHRWVMLSLADCRLSSWTVFFDHVFIWDYFFYCSLNLPVSYY